MEPGLDNAQTRTELQYEGPIVDCAARDNPDAILAALAQMDVYPDTVSSPDGSPLAQVCVGSAAATCVQDDQSEENLMIPCWNDNERAPVCPRARLLAEPMEFGLDEEESFGAEGEMDENGSEDEG